MFNRQPSLFARLVGLERTPFVDAPPEANSDDLDALIDGFEETAQLAAEALAAGAITLMQFAVFMRREIRRLHLAAAVIGAGGTQHATPQTRA